MGGAGQQQQQQQLGEGSGDAAEPPARILHLSINPTSQAFKFWDEKQRALMAALRAEVDTCRAAIAAGGVAARPVEVSALPSASSGGGSGSGGSGSVLAAEKEDAKKLQQRTVEIFRERVSRMRDICNRLLGWKMELDFAGAGADQVINIKLSSLYATSAAAQFRLRFDLARQEFTVQQYAEGTDTKNYAYVQVSK